MGMGSQAMGLARRAGHTERCLSNSAATLLPTRIILRAHGIHFKVPCCGEVDFQPFM